MTVLAGRRWLGVTAWSLAGFTVLVLVAALVLLGLNASRMTADRIGVYGIFAIAVLVYAGVGRLIVRRLPGNAIGWLLCLIGLSLAATMFLEQHALRGLTAAADSLPAARLAGWLSWAAAVLMFALLFFVVLLFPDGRLLSRRWRPVVWALIAVVAGWTTQLLQSGTKITGGMTNALVAAGVAYPNPLGVFPRHGWFSGFILVIFFLALVTAILTIVSVFVRRRGASSGLAGTVRGARSRPFRAGRERPRLAGHRQFTGRITPGDRGVPKNGCHAAGFPSRPTQQPSCHHAAPDPSSGAILLKAMCPRYEGKPRV